MPDSICLGVMYNDQSVLLIFIANIYNIHGTLPFVLLVLSRMCFVVSQFLLGALTS